jgi:thioester reductase-like protein
MAATVQNATSATFHGKESTIVKHVETVKPKEQSEPQTIDNLIRHRAKLLGDTPLVFYPHSGIEYVGYSIRQLDVFAYRVAQKLSSRLPSRISSSEKPIVVSFLGPSDLNYLVTFWALSKLGHSVLFLSTRISLEAYVSLLERTESKCIVIDREYQDTAHDLSERIPGLQVDYIAQEDWYNLAIDDDEEIDTNLTPTLDSAQEAKYVSWIIHSSGSTGLPKPIFQTQKAAIQNYAHNMNMRGFITLPLYHNHGMSCLFRSLHSCKSIHLYNPSLPLARKHLLGTMNLNDFEVFYGVPYALKLLAETEEGIQALAKFKLVLFSGSPCPDSLGDKLVANGVHLISQYGSTETGQLMTSVRPREDKLWDYLRLSEAVKPFLRFEERSPGLYESVVLDGWPSKVMSNRPDGSYATKDLFTKHPDFEGYKYCARLDDTLVLVNGEKVIPLALEGSVRQDPAVAEVIVFGAQRASIGMIVIMTEEGAALSRDQLIEQIWPRVEQAQSEMPAFGQLSRDMVVLLPPDTQYPRTDKGTVIRQAVYRTFADLIENTYNDQATGELLALTEPGLREFLQEQLQSILPSKARGLLTEDADFFNIGMDSLQTTQLRSIIVRQIDTSEKELGLNVAFDHPSINLLARHLLSLRSGVSDNDQSVEDTMQSLIEKYSAFQQHKPLPNGLDGRYIAITGASGSLGSHTAAKLALQTDTRVIYCLIRAGSILEAYERLIISLRERRLYDSLSDTARAKLVALPVNLSDPKLGLEEHTYNLITSQVTDVIHCAWSVNFNWRLPSFEKDNIAGVKNLIDLCLKSQRPTPASFNFCSSVSTVVNTAENEIPEALPKSLSYAQDMGYAQSKLVAENICLKAAEQTGLRARALRIGQVIGDTQHGVWNTTEAIPLMIQSAKTIGALPRLDETHRWLPVDIVAEIIVEHLFSTCSSGVLNIINHNSFHWTRDLIPFLQEAGLTFEEVETGQWLEKLRASNPDPTVNPPIKLVEFWTTKYGSVEGPKKSFVWHTEEARRYSKALDETKGLDRDDVTKMVHYFKTVW